MAWFAAVDRQRLPQSLRKRVFRHLVTWLDSVVYDPAAARALIAVSEHLRADLVRFHRCSPRLPVIHHGVDCAQFTPDNVPRWRGVTRQALGTGENEFVALYVGDWQKSAESLLGILRRTESVTLWIVTKTSRRDVEVQLATAGVRDRVRLVGPTTTIERIYAAADCLLFPSFYDAFGMVVAEAMASALPVIVSGAAGAAEWITHEQNGLVVDDPADAAGYSLALIDLHRDTAKRSALGSAARATAAAHSWDSVAGRTMEVYRSVLAATRTGRGPTA